MGIVGWTLIILICIPFGTALRNGFQSMMLPKTIEGTLSITVVNNNWIVTFNGDGGERLRYELTSHDRSELSEDQRSCFDMFLGFSDPLRVSRLVFPGTKDRLQEDWYIPSPAELQQYTA